MTVVEVGQWFGAPRVGRARLSPILGGEHERRRWKGLGAGRRSGKAKLLVAVAVVVLSSFVAAVWVLPRLISWCAVKMPARAPKEWVADDSSGTQ